MSHALFNLSPDLAQLREEGYYIQLVGSYLVMRQVPYVDKSKNVRRGTLISTLALAGDTTRPPDTHVIHFDGEFPCNPNGQPIVAISHQTQHFELGNNLTAEHAFSSKPDGGYRDYYHKMTTYASILSGPAAVLDKSATPRPYRALDDDDTDSVFNYVETASARAGIGALTARLANHRIGIVGLGGSGSYILDMVAKTPVSEIRILDPDEFLQHNAFRAPGAPTLAELRETPMKVDYFKAIYGRMHRGITAVPAAVKPETLHLLENLDFVFLSLDAGEAKVAIIMWLHEHRIPFIDIGMGLELGDRGLTGILRVTTSTPKTRNEIAVNPRIPLAGGGADDIYSSNIQVAELNALNAIQAVIKWKKLMGFYCDLECEHHSTYTVDGNLLLNEDQIMIKYKRLQHVFVDSFPSQLEPGKLYVSVEFGSVAHRCCCGCGEEIITPLTPTDWHIVYDGATISLHPSVGNWTLACRSHYVIRKGEVVEAPPWSDEQVAAERLRDGQAKAAFFGSKKPDPVRTTDVPVPPQKAPPRHLSSEKVSWIEGIRRFWKAIFR